MGRLINTTSRTDLIGTEVFIYKNLSRNCWSIRANRGTWKGIVVAHARTFALEYVMFKVSEAGRQRVLRERRKNVHAGLVGTLRYFEDGYYERFGDRDVFGLQRFRTAIYRPYLHSFFYEAITEQPVYDADMVIGTQEGIGFAEFNQDHPSRRQ